MASAHNATSGTASARQWASSPAGQLARIQAVVTVSCTIIAVLSVLGSLRRRTGNALLRLLVWAAFLLAFPVVSYTVGAMQSAPFRNELLVSWACLLLLLLGGVHAITAYALRDTEQQVSSMLNQGLHVLYVLLLLASYVNDLATGFEALLFLLWVSSAAKLGMRLKAYRCRSSETPDEDWQSYEYLNRGAIMVFDKDPVTMTGYIFNVMGDATVEKVWQCKGKLLSSGKAGEARRDLCLSFALFKLLRLRFSKEYEVTPFSCSESRKFVLNTLVSEDQDVERVFRVIEVELGFLYDFFYTRYPSPKEPLVPDAILSVTVVATLLAMLFSALIGYRTPSRDTNIVVHGFNLDVLLTRVIVVLFIVLESYQFLTLITSDWYKVRMICRYVSTESWQGGRFHELFVKFLCRFRVKKYWKNSISQYSLLDNIVGLSNPIKSFLSFISFKSLDSWMMTTSTVRLSKEVKQALVVALRRCKESVVLDGRSSLRRNGLDDLFSACRDFSKYSYSERILIWHVATGVCDYKQSRALQMGKEDYEVATKLSKYCAYLVAFAPGLLADHSHCTQLAFESELRVAVDDLKGCATDGEKYDKLMKAKPDESNSLVALGASLGLKLIDATEQNVELRWKVLAELWAELMLYVTPADNANAHAENLATGGELITHLWALLMHAGIFVAPPLWLEESTPLLSPWPESYKEPEGLSDDPHLSLLAEPEMAKTGEAPAGFALREMMDPPLSLPEAESVPILRPPGMPWPPPREADYQEYIYKWVGENMPTADL